MQSFVKKTAGFISLNSSFVIHLRKVVYLFQSARISNHRLHPSKVEALAENHFMDVKNLEGEGAAKLKVTTLKNP